MSTPPKIRGPQIRHTCVAFLLLAAAALQAQDRVIATLAFSQPAPQLMAARRSALWRATAASKARIERCA